jgi:hypothetical protein
MKQSEIYRQNAENCAYLAEGASNEPTRQRYKRMEAAWRALADEQDWLDGETSPARKGEVEPAADSGSHAWVSLGFDGPVMFQTS